MKSMFLFAAAAFTLVAVPAAAVTFTLSNDLGGDGFVNAVSDTRFDLFGSNDDTDDNITRFGATATVGQIVSGQFRYRTNDIDGSNFDPAGYFINGLFFQLSEPDLLPYTQNSGRFSFSVNQNDTYGFYVSTLDGASGRGVLTVGAIPEPSTWAMLIAGFGLVGATLRRRRAVAA